MRHHVKKIKFRGGQDSTEAIVRKLALNFIRDGKIETTVKKGRVLKSVIERLVYKAKEKKESNKNVLLQHLADKKAVSKLFDTIAPVFKDRVGGFVKLTRIGVRLGDGSQMTRVEWIKPVIEVKTQRSCPPIRRAKVKSTTEKLKVSLESEKK